jgi:MFS family permease
MMLILVLVKVLYLYYICLVIDGIAMPGIYIVGIVYLSELVHEKKRGRVISAALFFVAATVAFSGLSFN